MVGFIGLGTMGAPMAANLLVAGTPLLVWNRTASRCTHLADLGARVAESAEDIFEGADVVFIVLAHETAVDSVLQRRTPTFDRVCRDCTVVNMVTTSSAYSASLASDVRSAGGSYVEAPVSGSRIPAERGELVVMLAGREDDVERVRPILQPMCSQTIYCGPEPSAQTVKHASNLVLAPMLAGLAEGTALARRAGVDLDVFARVLLGGQIANGILRAKLPKLIDGDYSPQGAMKNALESVGQSVSSAREFNLDARVAELCLEMLEEAVEAGLADEDVVALEKVVRSRTGSDG